MNAFKCDRCGVYCNWGMGSSRVTVYTMNAFHLFREKKTYDICPDCARKIKWYMRLELPENESNEE